MSTSHLNIAKYALLLCVFASASFACSAKTNLARVTAPQRSSASAFELLQEGSAYYIRHDFERAIPPYQMAVDLEKQHPSLDKTFWRVLVDNLAIAYGVTGELEKSRETLVYGIEKDPKYPMFYYNMACYYGEKKNQDKTIEYLRLAFDRRENMIEGEEMPNPATDSSFKSFMKNEKFKAALKGLKQK
ncbi:MAG TPA: hypothetical protein VLL54_04310 [Pyrinomonadaceae bacterium]|nr:hypothetical protein [Pyrinomonadaceae bacterium]